MSANLSPLGCNNMKKLILLLLLAYNANSAPIIGGGGTTTQQFIDTNHVVISTVNMITTNTSLGASNIITAVATDATKAATATYTSAGSLTTNLYARSASEHNFPNVARLPHMGWFSWGYSTPGGSSNQAKLAMDGLDLWGMRELGWKYIQVDFGWAQATRDGNGKLQADPAKISDMQLFSKNVHDRGYKLGLYEEWPGGSNGHPPMRGFEYQDGIWFATNCPLDLLKYDCIVGVGNQATWEYVVDQYTRGLRSTGRDIISKSSNGDNHSFSPFMPNTLNEWCPGDVRAWANVNYINTGTYGMWATNEVWRISKATFDFADYLCAAQGAVGPGFQGDMDAMLSGSGWTNLDAIRSDFAIRAILASPLVLYNVPAPAAGVQSTYPLSVYTNIEAIAIDQDPLVIQGPLVISNAGYRVYSKPLNNGDVAVAMFNRSTDVSTNASFWWTNVGFASNQTVAVRDIWNYATTNFTGGYTSTIPAWGCSFLRLSTNASAVSTSVGNPGLTFTDYLPISALSSGTLNKITPQNESATPYLFDEALYWLCNAGAMFNVPLHPASTNLVATLWIQSTNATPTVVTFNQNMYWYQGPLGRIVGSGVFPGSVPVSQTLTLTNGLNQVTITMGYPTNTYVPKTLRMQFTANADACTIFLTGPLQMNYKLWQPLAQ